MDSKKQCDVVVAGAGIAGVAAALECARSGLKTTLVEKTVFPGGLATSGLIYAYLPICDGNGRQVTFGIAEELLHLSLRYGPGDVPPNWRRERNAPEARRYFVVFSPASFVLALDEALADAGVDVRLDTVITDCIVRRGRVAGVETFDKNGRARLLAKCVVDATGDADVAHLAGAPCATGRNWLSIWTLMASREKAKGAPLLDMLTLGAYAWGERQPKGSAKFDGTDARDVTRFVLEGRKLLREHLRAKRADRHDYFPLALPSMPQFRTTRHIVGEVVMTDGQDGRRVHDSIGMAADWRRAGPVWEIPYRALLPKGVKGLLAAGRCISSEGDAWEVTRVIPAAALTGQAAGVAATLAVRGGTTPDRLDTADVQKHLRKRGIPLHLDELGPRAT